MNHSDEYWRTIAPLADKARRILAQGDEYKERMYQLNEFRGRAGALRRTHPKEGASLVQKATQLAERECPPRPDDAMNLLQKLRVILPASVVRQIQQRIDFRFPGSVCQAILHAQEELYRFVGPPSGGLAALAADAPVTEAEIDSLRDRIEELEVEQRGIDRADQERVIAEQRRARETDPGAQRQRVGPGKKKPTLNAEAKRLHCEQKASPKEIKTVILAQMKQKDPNIPERTLNRRFHDNVGRTLPRERAKDRNKKSRRKHKPS